MASSFRSQREFRLVATGTALLNSAMLFWAAFLFVFVWTDRYMHLLGAWLDWRHKSITYIDLFRKHQAQQYSFRIWKSISRL